MQRGASEAHQEARTACQRDTLHPNPIIIFMCVRRHNRLQPRRLMLCQGHGERLPGKGARAGAQCPAISICAARWVRRMFIQWHGSRCCDAKKYACIAITAATYLRTKENFDRTAPTYPLFKPWDHGGVVKGQRCGLDPNFLMVVLGDLASLLVSITIRPVRRQNVVPTHWVRK
jgi:hypothetical protein